MGTAGLVAILTVQATLHANSAQFRWWWPTSWMIIPLAIFLVGLALLFVPVQRSPQPRMTPAERQRALLAVHEEIIRVNNLKTLRSFYAEGRMYQKRMRNLKADLRVPNDRLTEIADWEARVRDSLHFMPRFFDSFTFWIQEPLPDATMASHYTRMVREMEVLADAIRERERND
jgi:hypothetical protein